MEFTFILGNGCNFNCKYCFEQNKKGTEKLKFEHAKKLIDDVYSDSNPFNIDTEEPQILEFIGGEPLLYVDLMREIVEYFIQVLNNTPYNKEYELTFITNGYLLDTPKVMDFINTYRDHMELNCSIDGIKASHDKFRLDKSGNPTYDKVWNNFLNTPTHYKNLKWTLTADTAKYYAEAIQFLLNEQDKCKFLISQHFDTEDTNWATYGYKDFSKCVCELIEWYKGQDPAWIIEHPYRMIRCDYKPSFVAAYSYGEICTGKKIALDPDGSLVKCICASMVSLDRPDAFVFGHIENTPDADKAQMYKRASSPLYTFEALKKQECFRCPVGSFCGNCYVSNYCQTGMADEVLKCACNVHAIKHMEHVFFNNFWIKTYMEYADKPKTYMLSDATMLAGEMFRKDVILPKCWALEVLPEDIYNLICDITEDIGGLVSPLETKFYTQEQVDIIGAKIAQQGIGIDKRMGVKEYQLNGRRVCR